MRRKKNSISRDLSRNSSFILKLWNTEMIQKVIRFADLIDLNNIALCNIFF